MGKIIGIDLGTTNSCVSVVENGKPVIIKSLSGNHTTPSVIAFTKIGERLVGEAARRQAALNSDRTISSVKRHMGSNWKVRIDDREYKAQTVSAMILMQLKEDAEKFLGEKVDEAVITVPAYFDDVQRQATKDAGRIAGFQVRRIINEPTSAAISYGLDHGEPQKVMIYDLGGGTFDVSIIEIGEGVIEVLATAGDNHLGGDDFDKRITEWLTEDFKRETHFDLTKDMTAVRRVEEAAEEAKKTLSTQEQAVIELPYIVQSKEGPLHLRQVLTREKFDSLTKDLIEKTEGPVMHALNDAGIAASELGRVLLVGGSTRIPAVQQLIRRITGKESSRNINPDECVAMGAAVLGSTLEGNALMVAGDSAGLLLLDVIPLSLSIETVGGMATRLIDRNTTLPAKYAKIFTTAGAYQRDVQINVLQGERPMARQNKSIGKFRLNGIKRAPAGVPQIEVTFDIDANGILKVSAKDLDTGREQSVVITENDRMSEDEINQAIRDASENAAGDETKREAVTLMGDTNRVLQEAQQNLKENGKNIAKEDKKNLKNAINDLGKLLMKCKVEKITAEQIEAIKHSKLELENLQEQIFHRA